MNLDAMKELLAAVEADDLQSDIWRDIWRHDKSLPMHDAHYAKQAHKGDMNAALALHGALLPGWCLDIGTNTNAGGFFAMTDNMHLTEHPGYDDYTMASGDAATPAQALLIATLRGKIAALPELLDTLEAAEADAESAYARGFHDAQTKARVEGRLVIVDSPELVELRAALATKDVEIARLREALRKIAMYTEPPAEGDEDPESLVIQWSGEVARAALEDTP